MRALFVSAPVGSHLDWGGYLPTAAELVARGHDILWVSGLEVVEQVRSRGVTFQAISQTGWRWPLPPPLSAPSISDSPSSAEQRAAHEAYQQQRQTRALDQWLDVARVLEAVTELDAVAQQFQPGLIVSEMFMAAAAVVAEQRNCPFVVAGWPAPLDKPVDTPTRTSAMLEMARRRLDDILAATATTGINWTQHGPPALCSPLLHITYWSESWFGGAKSAPESLAGASVPIGPQTVHVGGKAPPMHSPLALSDLPGSSDRPWVFITLGTTFQQDASFFRMAVQATHALGGLPIVATGAPLTTPWVQALQAELPQPVVVQPWVELASVLPYAAAAIHHGGAGTTHAVITHGVPQIVIPHAADQMRQAHGVARTQIGYALAPAKTSVDALVQLLAAVMPDRAPARIQAQSLQAEFAKLGGPPAAADHLEMLGRGQVFL